MFQTKVVEKIKTHISHNYLPDTNLMHKISLFT